MCNNNNEVSEYINYQTGEKLNLERVEALPNNTMLRKRVELWIDWDFEKNSKLGLDIWKTTFGTGKTAWWICPKCNSNYDATVCSRGKYNCPYCRGYRVNHTNSLASLNPALASQWHPTKNENLTPNEVTCSSNQKVWWLGTCGHEWNAVINTRDKGNNCPYCTNQKVLKGFNDMWTTNPELAKLLADPEDGYKYMQSSHSKVDWKCLNCGEIAKEKTIYHIKKDGVPCPLCSDGVSYSERLVHGLLNQIVEDFKPQKTFKWSNGKRYDFYVPLFNLVIETHGAQHYYDGGFEGIGGRSLKEEQANDQHKYELAIQNGIKEYIVIDCRKSDFEFIKNNILNSRLVDIFDLSKIDWEVIKINSLKSMVITVSELWNNGLSTKEMIKKTKLSNTTIIRYLKLANSAGLSVYDANTSMIRGASVNNKKIVKLNIDGAYILTYNSLKEASENNGVTYQCISAVCNGKRKTSNGFKWMYKEDYDKYIENQKLGVEKSTPFNMQ